AFRARPSAFIVGTWPSTGSVMIDVRFSPLTTANESPGEIQKVLYPPTTPPPPRNRRSRYECVGEVSPPTGGASRSGLLGRALVSWRCFSYRSISAASAL